MSLYGTGFYLSADNTVCGPGGVEFKNFEIAYSWLSDSFSVSERLKFNESSGGGGSRSSNSKRAAKKQKAVFYKGCVELGVDPKAPLTDKSNDFLLKAKNAWFPDASLKKVTSFTANISSYNLKQLNELNASAGTYPGSTSDGKFSGESDVYFHPERAFTSAEQLFKTMGHELFHVYQFEALAGENFSLYGEKEFVNMLEACAHYYSNNMQSFILTYWQSSYCTMDYWQTHPRYSTYYDRVSFFEPLWHYIFSYPPF